MDRFPDCGEFYVEGRTFAGSRANVNFSSVLFNYTVADGQAQSSAAPAGLGGEKGIEDPMDVIARNARAGVSDFDFDAAIVGGGAHFQHAATGHGIARIQEQIQEYLLELVRGSAHGGQSFT